MLRTLLIALSLSSLSSCAVTSSLAIPSCVDKLEISGEHQRITGKNGRQLLVFDHALDPPLSRTEVILKRDGHEETLTLWNTQPDGGRLLVGAVAGIFGGVLFASSAYDVYVQRASIYEEGPFYAAVFGTAAVGFAGLVMLTGWHPGARADIEEFCVEPGASSR